MSRKRQRQALVLLVYASVTLFIIYTVYNEWYLSRPPNYTQNSTVNRFLSSLTIQEWKKSTLNSSVPRILLWTPFFGRYELYYYGVTPTTLTNCPFQCTFTTDKMELMSSDAVIFHIRDIQSVPLPSIRHPDQVWIFFNRESPDYTFVDLKPYAAIFNWTLTYRFDSDVYHPYGIVIQKEKNSVSPIPGADFWHYNFVNFGGLPDNHSGSYLAPSKVASLISKPKLVAWIVSHCVTHSNREAFVKELREHIEVDVYGTCGSYSCPPDEDCYKHVASKYKFYLSFENSLCTDYVTEKYFDALRNDIVPVVYGRANYSHISPPNSFIDARKFNSSKDLADYLLYLNTHDEEYLAYFKWKKDYTVVRSSGPGWCALCEKLRNHVTGDTRTRNTYENIKKWWNIQPQPTKLSSSPESQSDKVKIYQKEEPTCLDIPVFKSEGIFDRLWKMFL